MGPLGMEAVDDACAGRPEIPLRAGGSAEIIAVEFVEAGVTQAESIGGGGRGAFLAAEGGEEFRGLEAHGDDGRSGENLFHGREDAGVAAKNQTAVPVLRAFPRPALRSGLLQARRTGGVRLCSQSCLGFAGDATGIFSSAWMRVVVCALQSFHRQMRVNLRGHQMGVTQQFLDTAQIRSGIQQMGCVTVPQFVRRQFRIKSGDFQIAFQAELRRARRHRSRYIFLRDKNRKRGFAGMRQLFPIVLDRGQGRFADRQQSFFLSFAANANCPFLPTQIFATQSAKFADAQSTGIDRFQNRHVAEKRCGINDLLWFCFVRVLLRRSFPLQLQIAQRRIEQRDHLLGGQELRQTFFQFRHRNILDGHRLDMAAMD